MVAVVELQVHLLAREEEFPRRGGVGGVTADKATEEGEEEKRKSSKSREGSARYFARGKLNANEREDGFSAGILEEEESVSRRWFRWFRLETIPFESFDYSRLRTNVDRNCLYEDRQGRRGRDYRARERIDSRVFQLVLCAVLLLGEKEKKEKVDFYRSRIKIKEEKKKWS